VDWATALPFTIVLELKRRASNRATIAMSGDPAIREII